MRINRNDSLAANGAPQAQPAPAAQEAKPQKPEPKKEAAPAKEKPKKKAEKKAYVAEEEETEHTKRRFPFGCLIVLIVLALVAFGGYKIFQFYGEIDGSNELGEEQTVTIEQGSSVGTIATQLKDAGIIQYDWLFKEYVKYSGKAGGIQYGDFTLRSGMDYNDIIQIISTEVRRPTTNVTIPEGTTAVGVAQIFVDAGLVDSVDTFLDCANGTDGSDFSQYSFWTQIPDDNRLMKCEGYLFPDTYNVYADENVYYYVDTLYSEFQAKTEGLTDTINAKGTTMDDVVKLASFIQEEAGLESEDAKVSACFHNRLESSDPLWADHKLESNACSYITQDVENNYLWNSPTAEYYGWPEAGSIPEEVLNQYDTYRISGLPAGPISCPGYAAIEAALNPDQEYLDEGYYFFVTGHPDTDVAGQYFYAKTAEEHEANVEKAGWKPNA
ncbi:endolytic transglycosylase MltG [Subdoligranulum variabile]|uniref:endolytic transglycosylase MltG n=1 Tax=Subdoligranulum variabile TaxID=214851 RepID=UPI0029423505|nr:endolytic transglycosylase MltG [Subdoligranulum variabile]